MEDFSVVIDDMRIDGRLHLPTDGSTDMCVITCHGMASSKSSSKYLGLAERVSGKGACVVRFDFRGCGKSEGAFADSHVSRRLEDLEAVMVAVRDRLGPERIGLFGSSMGAYLSLIRAGEDPRIDALVCLATPHKLFDIREKEVERHGKERLRKQTGYGPDFTEDLKQGDRRLEEALDNIRAPVLLVHGGRDELVPPSNAVEIAGKLGDLATLKMIDGGDHVFSRREHLEDVIRMAADWFDEHL